MSDESTGWTILRPSVLVGPEDEFANALARWLVITPLAFPLVGDGQARFQPLCDQDIVTILSRALVNRARCIRPMKWADRAPDV